MIEVIKCDKCASELSAKLLARPLKDCVSMAAHDGPCAALAVESTRVGLRLYLIVALGLAAGFALWLIHL